MKINDNLMEINDNLMKLNDNSMKLDQPGLPLWLAADVQLDLGSKKLDIGRQKGIFCKRENRKMEVKNMKMYK